MLVLSRKVGEEIIISGVVIVRVIKIEGSQVKLGIKAPKDVPIYRKELIDGSRQVDPANS